MKRTLFGILVLTILATASLPISVSTAAANPYGTATIDPAAPNEVILTITKGKTKTAFAFPRLEKMKYKTITIYEPFVKQRQRFTVIPLAMLFTLAGISGDDKVLTTALNDYRFSATAQQFIDAGAYLAIRKDGAPIGYNQGGPIRIIYSDKSKWAKNLDAWNWSIESISVK